MFSRLFAVLALLFSVLPAQHELTIGTWNLEFLGADPKYRRDTLPRDHQDLLAIGRRIRELGVAVLGVQEICGEAPLQEVVEGAGPTYRFVLGTTGKWNDGKTQQAVGFVYDSAAVDLLHTEELLDFPSESRDLHVFHRKPVTACFRDRASRCDFRVVIVHLKAGRKPTDRAKRTVEAETLRHYVDKLLQAADEDHDIVILGDFNSSYGDPPERILEAGGAMQFVEPPRKTPTVVHFDTPIDHICVARDFAELQRDSLKVHAVTGSSARASFRKTYSDHFPVTVRLRADRDDDPDAHFTHGPPSQVLPVTRRAATKAAPTTSVRSAWPPQVGTRIEVRAGKRTLRGTLAAPLPTTRGWVVVDTGTGTVAVPMVNVDSLEVGR